MEEEIRYQHNTLDNVIGRSLFKLQGMQVPFQIQGMRKIGGTVRIESKVGVASNIAGGVPNSIAILTCCFL